MSQTVTMGAVMACSFGAAPSTLVVLPTDRVTGETKPVATIMDNQPIVNIPPFGMCSSLANPTVASATSAAQGVLTPMPCIPMTSIAPWTPGSPTVTIAGKPVLNNNCKLTCQWGGLISINQPGTVKTSVP